MLDILRNAQFWTLAIGIVSLIVSALVPELSEDMEFLQPGIVAIILIVVAGGSLDSVWDALRTRPEFNIVADTRIGQLKITARQEGNDVKLLIAEVLDVIEDFVINPDDSAEEPST